VTRDATSQQAQVSFSHNQNYHPYIELNDAWDLWLTVWLRADVPPFFCEVHLEDGSKNTLRVPFITSTGYGLPAPAPALSRGRRGQASTR
jgi:hypothetical protein